MACGFHICTATQSHNDMHGLNSHGKVFNKGHRSLCLDPYANNRFAPSVLHMTS